MNCGVYRLRNTISGECYIGGSASLEERRRDHLTRIRSGTHTFPLIRQSVKRDGAAAFVFEVVEECEPETLAAREKHWLTVEKPALNRRHTVRHSGKHNRSLTSVRIDRKAWAMLERLGQQAKPVPVPVRTMIDVAVCEYVERHGKKSK